jgi:hypothetical protein
METPRLTQEEAEMDYYLVPELAAIAPMIPRMDFADAASARAITERMSAHIAPYQPGQPLTVADTVIPGGDGVLGIPEVHQYSGAFHLAHAFPGTVIGARMLADRNAAICRLLFCET